MGLIDNKLTKDELKALIFETIENVMQRGNAGVSISFLTDGGVYMNIYPYNDDEEEKETV